MEPFRPITPKVIPAQFTPKTPQVSPVAGLQHRPFVPMTPKAKQLAANSEISTQTQAKAKEFGSRQFIPMTPKAKELAAKGFMSQRANVRADIRSSRMMSAQPVARWEPLNPPGLSFCHTVTSPMKLPVDQLDSLRQQTFTGGLSLSDILSGKRNIEVEAQLIREAQPVGQWMQLDLEPGRVTLQEYEHIKEIYENNQTVLLNQLDRRMITQLNAARSLQMLEEWMVCFTVDGHKLVSGGMSVHCDDDAREFIGEFPEEIQKYLDTIYKRWGKTNTKGKRPFAEPKKRVFKRKS